jgi:hypothetical protein
MLTARNLLLVTILISVISFHARGEPETKGGNTKTLSALENRTNITLNTSIITNKLKPVKIIQSKNSKNLEVIVDKLRETVAKECKYGHNPRLLDICPDLKRTRSHSFLQDIHNVTLDDIRHSIVNYSVVSELQMKCFVGEWCLKENVFDFNTNERTYKMQLTKNFNSKLYCQVDACYNEISSYIKDCVRDEISRSILSIAPKLCTFNNNIDNQFCPEQTMRLIHTAVAAFSHRSSNKNPQPNSNV